MTAAARVSGAPHNQGGLRHDAHVFFPDGTKPAFVAACTSDCLPDVPKQSTHYVDVADTVRVAVRVLKDHRDAG